MEQATPNPVGQPTETTERQGWAPAPAHPSQQTTLDRERFTRNWLLILTLAVFSISLLTALIAANQAITIWLQPQYAPFVRLAGAAAVAVASLFVVLRLMRRT